LTGVAAAVFAPSLAAQGSVAADTLSGRVIAADSTPIPQATVRATTPEGLERATTTDAQGRYLLAMQAGAGSYAIQASAFGYLSFTAQVEREPGTRRIRRDFRLSARPVMLEAINVVAPTPAQEERATPAERAGRWDAFLTHQSPLDPGSFADIGTLVPGVARSGTGLSMAGQSPDQNGTTVDGATFGGSALPSEGVRNISVVGTTYDVSRGQFSGGQVAASTISGTNLWGVALTARGDHPRLSYGGSPAALLGQGEQLRVSAGGGGPLVRDRLFIYGALDVTRARSTLAWLQSLNARGLREVGVSPDSATRFADIARGLGAVEPYSPPDGVWNGSTNALARADWALPKNGTLTARLDWRRLETPGLGASPFRLAGESGRFRTRDAGVMLQHAVTWGRIANTLRVYHTHGESRTGDGSGLPAAMVRVASELDDGTTGLSFLSFGGAAGFPADHRDLWEVADDVKLASPGGHQFRAGLVLQEQRAWLDEFSTPGTFTYESLDDLEQGHASSFSRALGHHPGRAERRYGALYLGDSWRSPGGVSLIYGLRAEGSRYAERPDLLPGLDSIAGLQAAVPSAFVVTPRFGFAYAQSGDGDWLFDGGFGGFAGVPVLGHLAPRWGQTGAGNVALSCVGPAAPTPEWARYAGDPATVPETCDGGNPLFSGTAPMITVFDPGYGGARTWRASLSGRRRLTPLIGLSLDGLLVLGTGLPTAVDRNLREAPTFTLASEAGRPVYAAPAEIDPRSGDVAPGAGRILSGFGPVDELGSRGESRTAQLGIGLGGAIRGRIITSLRYSLTHSRVLAGGVPAPGASPASTAGNPARLEWVEAPFTPRHQLFASMSGSPLRRTRLTAIAALSSGLPFTPMVGGDVNGDGRANDRAFLFSPESATDPEVAEGMRRLMDESLAGVRGCLTAGAGRIAAPGACRTPWSPSLDLRMEYTPWGAQNARRFVLGIDARNVTAGLDYLLHGPERLRGWGQSTIPDATLLEVRGFDPARREFLYDVNPRFGRPVAGLQRIPFRLVVEGRITVGADPRYQPLMQAIEMNSGRSRESVRAQLLERLRNVPAAVLQLDATDTAALALSPAQRAFLRAAADSLAPMIAGVADSLATAFTAFTSPVVRAARVQEASLRAVSLHEIAIERARAILTPEQWARVPAWLTRPAEVQELQRSPTLHITIEG
jgi:hypothetical protein